VQNVKVKIGGKDSMASAYASILQFEIYNLPFALAMAEGRALILPVTMGDVNMFSLTHRIDKND